MNYFSLIAILLISSFGSSDGASCTSYTSSGDCNLNDLCEWIVDSTSYCGCASSVPQDILFVMDISGSVGSSAWSTEQDFVSDMISTGVDAVSNIAVMTFGSGAWGQWNFTDDQSSRSTITDLVEDLPYTGGATYMRTALKAAITIFDKPNAVNDYDNLLMFITDGNPYPSFYQSVCCSSCSIKASLDDAGVTVVIIGVGDGYDASSVDCLVEDTDTQIIEVQDFSDDDFAAVRQYTDSFLCPATISLTLTEVRTEDKTGGATDARFVEFYNGGVHIGTRANPLILGGILDGTITNETVGNITAGSYIVFYDSDRDDPNCYGCDTYCDDPDADGLCADVYYISCNGANDECTLDDSFENDDWYVQVQDGSDDSYIVNVTVLKTPNDWPAVTAGWTFELQDRASADFVADNWEQSCLQYGTPGDAPLTTCSGACDDDSCQINGDTGASCSSPTGSCVCTSANGYYQYGSSCFYLDSPNWCQTDTFRDEPLSSSEGRFQTAHITWGEVDVQGGDYLYKVVYLDGAGDTEQTTENEFWYAYFTESNALTSESPVPVVRVEATINGTYIESDWTECNITTSAPTKSPTNAPTWAVPPIDDCNATLQKQSQTLDIVWTAADVTVTDAEGVINGYYIFYLDKTDTDPDKTWVWEDSIGAGATSYSGISLTNSAGAVFDENDIVLNISALVYDSNGDVDLSRMLEYATDCSLHTLSPTAAPTQTPTNKPSPSPVYTPSNSPTPYPTYQEWTLTDCVGTIDKDGNGALYMDLEWSQNSPGSSREVYMRRTIDGTTDEEEERLTAGDADTSTRLFVQDDITGMSASDTWYIYPWALDRAGGTEYEQNGDTCNITSGAPTSAPTDRPTQTPTARPSGAPSEEPTATPTKIPTQSPTFEMFTIDCSYTLEPRDGSFFVTFIEPTYDSTGELTPIASEVRYIFSWIDDSGNAGEDSTWVGVASGDTFYREIELSDGIDIDQPMYAKAVWTEDTDIVLASPTVCDPNTQMPSEAPTTAMPTPRPTYEDPTVYIDIDSIESNPNCDEDVSPITCWLSEADSATSITMIREPEEFGFDVTTQWEITWEDRRRTRRALLEFTNGQGFDIERIKRRLLDDESTSTTTEEADSGDETTGTAEPSGWVTSDDFAGATSGKETIDASTGAKENEADASFHLIQEDDSEDEEGQERFYFTLTSCNSTGGYSCSIVDPSEVLVYVENTGDNLTTNKNTEDLPEWVWYPIAAGVLLLPIVGWLGWRMYNKKKLAEHMEQQRKQELQEQMALDDAGNFGEVGDAVQFNPLATGGTQDIATGGDYIQNELDAQKANFEVAHVDIETNVFRQDFGPVQTNQRA